MLAELSGEVSPAAAALPAALLAGIKAQQAAAVVDDPDTSMLDDLKATDAPIQQAVATSEVDELALLEAELASAPAEAVTTAQVTQETTTRAEAAVTLQTAIVESGKQVVTGLGLGDTTASIVVEPEPAPSGLHDHFKTLEFFVDPNKFKIETRISDVDLDRCLMEQNSLRAYYGAQAAQAEAQSARTKMKFDIIEAKLYDYHRRLLLEDGEKVTEKMVETEVKKDARWATAKGKVIDADTISGINRALVESLRDRSSMLIQLSADRRDEFKGQRSTMAQTSAQEEIAARAAEVAKKAMAEGLAASGQ